jgi:hypothetical protein
MPTRLALLPIAASLPLLLAPAAADAGTVKLDQRCYVAGEPVVVTGSAFTPDSQLTLTSSPGGATFPAAVADATGAFQTRFAAPAPKSRGARAADVTSTRLVAVDPLDSTQTASTPLRIANFTVDRGTSRNPRSVRTWYFSGFPTGATIYGHFRYHGRTMANHRFGRATGACGLLHARARGIPVTHLRAGTWTIQVDTAKTYRRDRVPSLELKLSLS